MNTRRFRRKFICYTNGVSGILSPITLFKDLGRIREKKGYLLNNSKVIL